MTSIRRTRRAGSRARSAPYVKSPLSSRPIDSYLLRTHSDPSPSISLVDSDTDDDVTLLQSSQRSTESASSSMSPPSLLSPSYHPTQRATAATRKKRDRLVTRTALSSTTPSAGDADGTRAPRLQRIYSFFTRSSSLPVSISNSYSDSGDEDDKLPLSQLLSRSTQSSRRQTLSSSHSLSIPSSHSAPEARVALSVVTTVVDSPTIVKNRINNAKQRTFYQLVRHRFGYVDDGKLCRYCGERKHTGLHHEAEFRRHSNIRMPSGMRPKALRAEIIRCTREDGTIGLASLCNQCHFEADRQFREPSKYFLKKRPRHERNIKADTAAKLARGKCQCDNDCGVLVTLENLQEFEWDHLVQEPDDPNYRCVSRLVAVASLKRCVEERAKCRLLYSLCHKAHTQLQRRQRRANTSM